MRVQNVAMTIHFPVPNVCASKEQKKSSISMFNITLQSLSWLQSRRKYNIVKRIGGNLIFSSMMFFWYKKKNLHNFSITTTNVVLFVVNITSVNKSRGILSDGASKKNLF